jgi:hypothetical protein
MADDNDNTIRSSAHGKRRHTPPNLIAVVHLAAWLEYMFDITDADTVRMILLWLLDQVPTNLFFCYRPRDEFGNGFSNELGDGKWRRYTPSAAWGILSFDWSTCDLTDPKGILRFPLWVLWPAVADAVARLPELERRWGRTTANITTGNQSPVINIMIMGNQIERISDINVSNAPVSGGLPAPAATPPPAGESTKGADTPAATPSSDAPVGPQEDGLHNPVDPRIVAYVRSYPRPPGTGQDTYNKWASDRLKAAQNAPELKGLKISQQVLRAAEKLI